MAKKKQKGLSARHKAENHEDMNARGFLKIPEGMSVLKFKEEGPVRLDIVPYKLKADNAYAEAGELWYEKTFYVHQNVGPERAAVVCPKSNDPEAPCPVCEFIGKNRNDWDVIRPLRPQERQLFNVIKAGEPDKMYIINQAYKTLGEKMDDRIKNADVDEHFEFFADPDKWTEEDAEEYGDSIVVGTPKGMTMKLSIKPKSFGEGNRTFMDVNSVDFKTRKYTTRKLIEMTACLDDVLTILSYEKIAALMGGVPVVDDWEDDDEDDEPKKLKKKSRPTDDEDDDDDEPAPPKKSKSKPVDDEDEEPKKSKKSKPVDDFEDEDDEDDDEPPKKSKAKQKEIPFEDDDDEPAPKKSKAKSKPVDNDDDDDFASDEDDDDDEPAPPKKSKKEPAKDSKKKSAVDDWDDDDDF